MADVALAKSSTRRGHPALPRVDRATIVVVGLSAFYVAMTVHALLVFQQFSDFQVLSVALSFALLFGALVAVLSPDLRRVRLHPTWLSVALGLVMAGILLVVAFTWQTTSGPIWADYFPSFPITQLDQGDGFHQDAVFHVSLIQSILDFGYPSTGQSGTPFVPYHVLSHYVDALVLFVTRLEPYDSYGLFFHFKIALFLIAIVTFIWTATLKHGRLVFLACLVFLTPVLLSTWIGVGSHSLWLTSLILLLSATRVYDIVSGSPSGPRQYAFLFLVGVAVGLGKVSSGLMFVAFVGAILWLKNPRRRAPYVLLGGWVVFYAAYGKFFATGYGAGLQRPSVRGVLHFLDFFVTYGGGLVEWNLGAVYILLVFFAVVAAVFKSRGSWLFAGATAAGIAALTVATQLLGGLTQPDLFYFIYGLLVPVLLLGIQQLLTDLRSEPKHPAVVKRFTPTVVRSALVVLLIASTLPLDKPPVNAFMIGPGAVRDSLVAANSGYFDRYNFHQAPDAQVSVLAVLGGRGAMQSPESEPEGIDAFREALRAFMADTHLTSRDTLLFVPKEVFDDPVTSFGGPSWASGMMLYAVLGVPLLHGISDDSIRSFGQTSYGADALQQTAAAFDPADACNQGKQVIVVRAWAPAEFELACPA